MRAEKITIYFGEHGASKGDPSSLQRFKLHFMVGDHLLAPRKIFVMENGFVSPRDFVDFCGTRAHFLLARDLRDGILSDQLTDEIDRVADLPVVYGEGTVPDSIREIACWAGCAIEYERLQPPALFAEWMANSLQNQIAANLFSREKARFHQALEGMRRTYKYMFDSLQERDTCFICQLDTLVPFNDQVYAFRGNLHIGFYQRLDDPPNIVFCDRSSGFLTDLVVAGIQPEDLTDFHLPKLVKWTLFEFMNRVTGEFHQRELATLPDDLEELERFVSRVASANPEDTVANIVAALADRSIDVQP
jgi:hypothetical protein